MNHQEQQIQCFREALQKAGIKVTHQRLEIIRALVYASGHPSAAEVYHRCRDGMPSLSLDTVYRTLKTLSSLGLIHPVGSATERIRFDADCAPHHHFLCTVCGEAYDFHCEELNGIPVPDAARALGRVQGTRMEVRGTCRHCLNHIHQKKEEIS